MENKFVTYSAFGAKGDGVTDDFFAIKAAHEYANENNLKVVAENATYYIERTNGTRITIKTDVDWSCAKFIIDDRKIVDADPERRGGIFEVVSDNGTVTYTPESDGKPGEAIRALNASAKDNGGLVFEKDSTPVIDLGIGYEAMVVIYNANQKQYIRYGGNANNGSDQHEILMLDKNGKVNEKTAIIHDFPVITSLTVKRIDDKPITIKGGIFTTRANQCKETYAYFSRGISITRPNTVIDGLEHYITDEGEHGNPYSAFISIQNTCNVTVQNCIVSGHRVYDGMSTVSVTPMGTYDISAGNSCNILWKNVRQHNFYHLDENGNPTSLISNARNKDGWYVWGIMGSNYCKNLVYDSCLLTRFDAHCGTYGASIINSEICALSIIGGGKLEVVDSIIHSVGNNVANLRADYGSTFSGDVIFKNLTFKTAAEPKDNTVYLFSTYYVNHFFGYKTYLPYTITVDNLKVESAGKVEKVVMYSGSAATSPELNKEFLENGEVNKNPMTPTRKLTVRNNKEGYTFVHPKEFSEAFANMEMDIE